MNLPIVFTFTEGILTFISPCFLALLPVYLAFLAGTPSSSNSDTRIRKNRLIVNSLGFVLGFTLTFVALGASATSLGHLLREYDLLLRKISGVIMIFFGLFFIGIIRPGFLERQFKINFQPRNVTVLTSLLFGTVFAIGWSPCFGPLLGSALMLAGSSKTVLSGMLLLLAYSLGLGIPLILSAIFLEKTQRFLSGLKKHSLLISFISGFILILTGILIFTDKLKYLNVIFI